VPLKTLGWVNLDTAKNQTPSVEWRYGNPAGTLSAHCEVLAIDRQHGSTELTLTWPGREEVPAPQLVAR